MMLMSYFADEKKSLLHKKDRLSEIVYNKLYDAILDNSVLDINIIYNFFLLCNGLGNYEIYSKLKNKVDVNQYLIDTYAKYTELDYYDLCLALCSFDNIAVLDGYKDNIYCFLHTHKDDLLNFFIEDLYGIGGLSYYVKFIKGKTTFNIPDYIKYEVNKKIGKMLRLGNIEEVDIAIYNYAKIKDFYDIHLSEDMINSICGAQNTNGSWGGEKGFYTTFALEALTFIVNKKLNIFDEYVLMERIVKGYNYIIYNHDYEKHINSVVVALNCLNNILS